MSFKFLIHKALAYFYLIISYLNDGTDSVTRFLTPNFDQTLVSILNKIFVFAQMIGCKIQIHVCVVNDYALRGGT